MDININIQKEGELQGTVFPIDLDIATFPFKAKTKLTAFNLFGLVVHLFFQCSNMMLIQEGNSVIGTPCTCVSIYSWKC